MALLYLHLSETLFEDDETQKQQCLMNALTILEGNQRMLRGKRMTFLCGDSGKDLDHISHGLYQIILFMILIKLTLASMSTTVSP